jgi:hypothetical protein
VSTATINFTLASRVERRRTNWYIIVEFAITWTRISERRV